MGEIHIRRAGLEDAPAVSDCVTQAYMPYISRIGVAPAPLQANYSELIKQHRVHVLVDDGRVVGVLALVVQEHRLLLENIAIHPEYQGRGQGTRMIRYAETEAQGMGLNVLALYTNELMTENIRWYRKLGYQEVERRVEQGYRRVFLEKRILCFE